VTNAAVGLLSAAYAGTLTAKISMTARRMEIAFFMGGFLLFFVYIQLWMIHNC
jgi:hypothetical protein